MPASTAAMAVLFAAGLAVVALARAKPAQISTRLAAASSPLLAPNSR
ncbi:MAG TPA: hypothetical protein VM388_04140 [Acidimicrobiales bacterium]|nr:hypothetical protein [Acidimicrobiales bacterium]HWI04960.1 hypothetical protein [Acidimicrobiales bacterium]